MRRIFSLGALLFVLAWQIVASSFVVLRSIALGGRALRSRWIWIDLAFKYDFERLILMHLITLTPGTISVLVRDDRKKLLIHVLDCTSEEDIRSGIEEGFSKRLREVFE